MKILKKVNGCIAVALLVLVASWSVPAAALAADKNEKDKPAQASNPAADQPAAKTSDKPASDDGGLVVIRGIQQLRQDLVKSDTKQEQLTGTAVGQQQDQPSSQQNSQGNAQNSITQPLAASPEVGHERVGVDLNQVLQLRLQDAIETALRNNLSIENSRQAVQLAQYNLFASRGVYDILSGANVNYNSATQPIAQTFQGAVNGSITQNAVTFNFNTSQLIQQTGGQWNVVFNNNRLTTSSEANSLPLQYNSTLTFQFVQPLMRNLSVDSNRHQIQVLKQQLDLSDSQFRQMVIQIINQVQDAYWNLVFAVRNEKIARDTVELTKTQLENDRKQVEAGTQAPITLRSDEAALEQRKGDVITALQNITTAENQLKGLLLKDPRDRMWTSVLQPVDEPEFGQPTLSLDEAIKVALKNRPELEQLKLQAEKTDLDIKFWKNQLKPQVDFVGSYGLTGLAGTPVIEQVGGLGTTDQLIVDRLNQALVSLGLQTIVPPPITSVASAPSAFTGGFFQDLRNLFGNGYRTWQVGVQFSFPWRNRTAQGNLGANLAISRQIDAQIRQEVEQVQIDVRNALQNVESARRAYLAAKAQTIAATAQYEGELEKFRAGLSTNFFVLQYQTDLATAQGTEVRALTNYEIALSDLQRVTGMTLVSNNVNVVSAKTN